jgi:hypothetical protein
LDGDVQERSGSVTVEKSARYKRAFHNRSASGATLETAEIVRTMIMNENQLVNQRLTWLLTFQGLLLAALGLAWSRRESRPLIAVFGFLGIAASLVSAVGLVAASRAMDHLVDWWHLHRPNDYVGPDVIGLPAASSSVINYMNPWTLFPLMFAVAWSVILLINNRRDRHKKRKHHSTVEHSVSV